MNQRISLKEVCQEITVGHVGPMADKYVDSGIPFLRSQNVVPFGIDKSNLKFIDAEFHKKLKKSALHPGDVVVVRTGYPGTASVIPADLPIANCADLVVIRPSDKIDAHFLCSLFNSVWGKGHVAGNLVGVAQQHFNIGAAREMEVSLPSIEVQRKLGSIVSTYSDLIENNTRRIKILEQMAQMLYREWFVNFRFPGHEKVKMVESELGFIPATWSALSMDDVVADIIDYRGKTPKKLGSDWANEGVIALSALNVKHGRLERLDQAKRVDDDLYKRWMKSELDEGDILMTSEAPLGEVHILTEKRKYCLSQRLFSIRANPKRIYPSLLYLFLGSQEGQKQLRGRSTGTTVLGIRQSELRKIIIPIPDSNQQEWMDSAVWPLLKQIDALARKNENLRNTRDLLLPKLVSGEVSVESLEEEALAETV